MKVSSNIPYICPSCLALDLVEKSVHEDYFVYSVCSCGNPMKPLSSSLGSYLLWDFDISQYRLNHRKLSFLTEKDESKLSKVEKLELLEASHAISIIKDHGFDIVTEDEELVSIGKSEPNHQINLL